MPKQSLSFEYEVDILRREHVFNVYLNGQYHAFSYPTNLTYSDAVQKLREDVKLINPNMSKPEPPPVVNKHPAVWDLVIRDMKDRDESGLAKYGTRLQPHNGRNALVDAYQEVLDLAVYLRQKIYEQDGK